MSEEGKVDGMMKLETLLNIFIPKRTDFLERLSSSPQDRTTSMGELSPRPYRRESPFSWEKPDPTEDDADHVDFVPKVEIPPPDMKIIYPEPEKPLSRHSSCQSPKKKKKLKKKKKKTTVSRHGAQWERRYDKIETVCSMTCDYTAWKVYVHIKANMYSTLSSFIDLLYAYARAERLTLNAVYDPKCDCAYDATFTGFSDTAQIEKVFDYLQKKIDEHSDIKATGFDPKSIRDICQKVFDELNFIHHRLLKKETLPEDGTKYTTAVRQYTEICEFIIDWLKKMAKIIGEIGKETRSEVIGLQKLTLKREISQD